MPVRKPYHHGDLRSALLAASLDLIGEKGSHRFAIREVARRAGVSYTAPYRHFRNKGDLLAAVAEEGFIRLTAFLKSAANKDWQSCGQLRNAIVGYVEFALEQSEQFGVMFSIDWDGKLRPSAQMAAERSFEALLSLVEQCRGPDSTGRYVNAIAARIAWAQAHGIAVLAMRQQHGFPRNPGIVCLKGRLMIFLNYWKQR